MATLIETNLIGLGVDAKSAKQISDIFQGQLDEAKNQKRAARKMVDQYQAEFDKWAAEVNRLQALIG